MNRAARRGPWLPDEDRALLQLVQTQGANNWVRISQQLQHRSPKQCRERYHQNLKPSLKHDPISVQEGEIIEQMVAEMGKRWAEIARHLGNRSDNAVKNWWNGSMHRRRRNPTQSSTGLKRIGSRAQPIPATNIGRSTVPATTAPTMYRDSYVHADAPVSQYPPPPSLLPPVSLRKSTRSSLHHRLPSMEDPSRSRRGHRNDLHDPVYNRGQHFNPPLESPNAPNHEQTFPKPAFSRSQTAEYPRELPALQSATGTYHADRKTSIGELPSTSPAFSEASQAMQKPPSLVSDNLSSCSVSPRTVTSPLPSLLATTDMAKQSWNRACGVPLPPPLPSDVPDASRHRFHALEPEPTSTNANPEPISQAKDSRMQLSSVLD